MIVKENRNLFNMLLLIGMFVIIINILKVIVFFNLNE